MRVLGLDIGEVRTGVAVSDRDMRVATPITVLETKRILADPRPLAELVEEEGVRLAVVGLPLTMAGEEGPQAARVREIAASLGQKLGLELAFVDERLSSAEASRALRAAGRDSRKQRGMLDMVAAALLLQGWLDANAADGADA
jgi:putative Holliday junction resolvase